MAATITPPGGNVTVTSPNHEVTVVTQEQSVAISSYVHVGGDAYAGTYEVTPTASEQVLPTEGRTLAHDVVVSRIPSNYGLITYNGSVITVS